MVIKELSSSIRSDINNCHKNNLILFFNMAKLSRQKLNNIRNGFAKKVHLFSIVIQQLFF